MEEEDKPVLDLALPNQDNETLAHDSAEDGEDVKKKKPSETDDDDEPPPPYSKNDPVEDDKSDNEGGDPSAQPNAAASSNSAGSGSGGGASNEGETLGEEGEGDIEGEGVLERLADHQRLSAPTESFGFEVQQQRRDSRSRSSENVLTSENDTDASRPSSQAQRSPASMSRISSPERGRTLSELTRITPEDESRIGTTSSTNLQLPAHDDQLESVYSSDTTLVNSESQPSQTEASHESSVSSIVADVSGTPRAHHNKKEDKKTRKMRIRGKKTANSKSSSSEHKLKVSKKDQNSSQEDKRRRHRLHSPLQKEPTSSQHNLMVNNSGLSQQAFTSSQDSNFDIGLSPEGESGEHSSEVDTEPREIKIQKEGSSSHGLVLTYDDKANAIVVKSVSSSGAVAKDGRIRVGDRIDSVSAKSMIGVSTAKARQIVKKAYKMDDLVIVYVPAVQAYIPNTSSLSYSGKRQLSSELSLNDSRGSLISAGSGGGGGAGQQQPTYRQQFTIDSQMPPQDNLLTSQAGGMTHHPPQGVEPIHMGPQITSGIPRLIQPTPQWRSMEPFHHNSMVPPNAMSMQQRGYYDDQMGKPPPPPYGYPHQSTTPSQGMMSNPPTYPPSLPTQPSHPIPWNIHQTPPQPPPSNFGMSVGIMQPPPGMMPRHWGIPPRPPPPMMAPHRDPPQYTDFHAMASTQQMGHSTFQNMITTSSGAHMSSMHSSGGGGAMNGSGSGHSSLQSPQQSQLPPRPTMNKSQSESKFQSGPQRVHHERRHNSQGTSDNNGHQFQVGSYHQAGSRAVQVRRHSSKQKQPSPQRQHLIEDVYDDQQKPWLSQDNAVVHRNSSGEGFANRKARSQPNISHGGGGGGADRERPDRTRPSKYPRAAALQESPDHSHHNSWAINDEEDPALRDEFPDVDGYLFEVKLSKGKTGGLGLSIVANNTSQAVRGIVIMGIQKGGAAEENGEIKWGDMILKVNDTCVIGMSQTQVQELLAKAPANVRFVLLRQYSNGSGGGGANNGRGGAKQQVCV